MNEMVARWIVSLAALLTVTSCSGATTVAPAPDANVKPGPESIVTAPPEALDATAPITANVVADNTVALTGTNVAQPVASDQPEATAIPDPITAITETRTYIDPSAGFAFDFPVTWSVAEYPGTMATITSFDPAEPGRGGMTAGETKIDVTVNLADTESDVNAMAARLRAEATVFDEQEWTLAGGVQARRITLRGEIGDEMALLLAVIDGRGLRVHGYGDLTLFDPIARTLRAAP